MIKKILKSIENISMTSGRFFSDKSFKFDTVFFIARYIYKYINNGEIVLDSARQAEMYNKICADFSLPDTSEASNKNYIREGLALLEYGNVISNVEPGKYVVKSQSVLDFITSSIENTYIFQYLIAYKTFVNDGLWDIYKRYIEAGTKQEKESILQELVVMISQKAQSIDETNTDPNWANSVTKFGIMVLALANDDYPVSRTLNIKKDKITPKELSANVSGTRSTTTKDNFYTDGFRVLYVRDMLKEYLSTSNLGDKNMVLYKNGNTKKELNIILYGAPGTGKTFSTAVYALAILENATKENIEAKYASRLDIMNEYRNQVANGKIRFTTFHQNYSYEDFIQGLRPDITTPMKFNYVDGVFKSIANDAEKDGSNNYVLIIDEINRANISKVFGELITLIETDKRKGEVNEIEVTLPSGEQFSVPNNLYIIGTMNSADKSISLIDAALRRRFKFIEVAPDSALVTDADAKIVLENINKELYKRLKSTDLLVGHSYFIGKSINDLEDVMNDQIIPLLYEYFFDNKEKVREVINASLDSSKFNIEESEVKRLKVKKI